MSDFYDDNDSVRFNNDYIQINIDWESVEKTVKKLNNMNSKAGDKALKEALNKTIDNITPFVNSQIKKQYTVRVGKIDGKVKTKSATQSNLSASVYTEGRPNALTYFTHSPTGKMVTKKGRNNAGSINAQVKKGGSRGTFPKAFTANVKAGNSNVHYGIFEEVKESSWSVPTRGAYVGKRYKRGRKRKDGTKSVTGQPYQRKKIKQFYGPATSEMFNNEKVKQEVGKELKQRFETAFKKAVDEALEKIMKK